MTILSVVQSASTKLVSQVPQSVYSSNDKILVELRDLANDVARDIADAHDWRALFKVATITGDGSDTDFALPSDYDRMPLKGEVHDVSTSSVLCPVNTADDYLRLQIDGFVANDPGYWIILSGFMNIYPALGTGKEVKFAYLRNTIVSGGTKTEFTTDTDTFDLDERLLMLGLVWRWRAQKRLEYSEDMATYNDALSVRINKDRGSRILAVGPSRFPANVGVAYPRALGS